MSIGANIKKLRKEKGLTQQNLADMIDRTKRSIQKYESGEVSLTSRTNIHRYENDIREPRVGTIELIAQALDVTVQELITGEKQEVKLIEKDITMFTTDELLAEIRRRITE